MNLSHLIACQKCLRIEDYDTALANGWLIAPRKDGPPGSTVVRCPDHTTEYSRKLAGLPEQLSDERIRKLIERGVYTEPEPGHRIEAWTTKSGHPAYVLIMHSPYKDEPDRTLFYDFDTLVGVMRSYQPDMRRWKIANK